MVKRREHCILIKRTDFNNTLLWHLWSSTTLSGLQLVNLPNQCSKILSQDSKIITWIFLPTLIHRNGDINRIQNIKKYVIPKRSGPNFNVEGDAGGGFHTPPGNSGDTSLVSYTQFWHCVPADTVRSHQLRAQPHKTAHTPLVSDTTWKSELSPVLLTKLLRLRGSHHHLFRFHWFARVTHRTQETSLLTRLLVYYKRA